MRKSFSLAAFMTGAVAVATILAVPTGSSATGGVEPGPTGRSARGSVFDDQVFSLIVKYRIGSVGADVLGRSGATASLATRTSSVLGAEGGAVVTNLAEPIGLDEAQELVARLEADPLVEWAQVNRLNHPFLIPDTPPNDALWGDMWSLWSADAGIGIANDPSTLTSVWNQGRGSGVTVAVLDTGIISHPDLSGQTVAGYDFVSSYDMYSLEEWPRHPSFAPRQSDLDGDVLATRTYGAVGRDSNPLDPGDWSWCFDEFWMEDTICGSSWHGTHVAGTIAARADNRVGIVGVAPQAKIQPIRVLGWPGGLTSDIADAIRWAAGGAVSRVPNNRTPAQVINLSLGGLGPCEPYEQDAIDFANSRGAIVVVAAGNETWDATEFSPANCDGVITVAATGPTGDLAWYSNFGDSVEVAAPGGDFDYPDGGILSTLSSTYTGPGFPASFGYPRGGTPVASYDWYQGTSMAAPHVAGALAVIRSARPSWTRDQVIDALLSNARPHEGPSCLELGCGTGIIDLAAALPPIEPSPPTGVKVRASRGTVTVSWTAPTSNGGASISEYTATVHSAATGGTVVGTCETSTRSCTVSGLARPATYFVDVVATNEIGSSVPSAPRVRVRVT